MIMTVSWILAVAVCCAALANAKSKLFLDRRALSSKVKQRATRTFLYCDQPEATHQRTHSLLLLLFIAISLSK